MYRSPHMTRPFRQVAVYCGSNRGQRPEYAEAARQLGSALAQRGLVLVYGGTQVGTMGILADAALEAGGEVVGVIPEHLAERGISHRGLSDLIVVNSMHARKKRMMDEADAIVALPGGLGTLEELLEAATWTQLGLHVKPCGLLNVGGFYDPFMAFINHAAAEGFIAPWNLPIFQAASTPGELLDKLEGWEPQPGEKWMTP